MKTNPHAPTCKNNINMFGDADFWVPASANISLMVTKWQTQGKEGRRWLNKCSLGCSMQVFYSVMRLMISVSNFCPMCSSFALDTQRLLRKKWWTLLKWQVDYKKKHSAFVSLLSCMILIRRQVESRQTKLHVCYWLVLCYHLSQFQLPVWWHHFLLP